MPRYAPTRGEKVSRVRQIVEWLGADFDGVIIFDEAHAMQNAAGGKGERGDQSRPRSRAAPGFASSMRCRMRARRLCLGDRRHHGPQPRLRPTSRPLGRRGLSVSPRAPSSSRRSRPAASRRWRCWPATSRRSVSTPPGRSPIDGVEYELVEHELTPEQIRIYDAYAGAFSVIHNNLDAAMEAANITGATGTLNAQAKSAARSAFESAKQRFFNHLMTAMKTPSLIASIERDLAAGHAAVIQIVSTGEALMERRLAEIPTEEWGDVQVDITPREYVLDYLAHSFPVQLYEPFTDSEGNLSSRPVFRDGQPVQCRDAVARRDRLIEKLASLPPVHGALDQIVQHFGTDMVAEVTGRSRRIVRKTGATTSIGSWSRTAPARPISARPRRFMDDLKRILVFSRRRRHRAQLSRRALAPESRLRVHYLLEAGWKADAAIQGLGRTNRTNQAQPPLFRPIATNVKAEKRFLSTIARRLDTLGAITRASARPAGRACSGRGQSRKPLRARCAAPALCPARRAARSKAARLQAFEDATGLKLMDARAASRTSCRRSPRSSIACWR
jgi:hypothetical protein